MKVLQFTTRVLTLMLFVCALGAAFGQAINSGDIRGTATDPSGALLPGVTVTVVNINTGITKVLTTNKDGLYDTSSIVVGSYSVTFEKQGFSKFERSNISLAVGTSTVNATMKVGATTESIVVNTDLPLLDTESGQQQTTLEANSMQVLPNVGQDWENFTILLPGTSGFGGETSPGQLISANGNLPYSNILADGATNTLNHSENADISVFETVQEVQINTSSFSAQYGLGGIIFNQISKGGTDKFHGTLYDYFQSSQFNSTNALINQNGTAAVYSHRYNNPGGSIGGPIPIWKLKNKAFFYFNYDQQISHGANGVSGPYDIPTPAVMGGDFTGELPIYDPTTQVTMMDPFGNPYPFRQSFQDEYGSNAIPTNLFDTVSANFQKFFPTPTSHVPTGVFLPGYNNNEGANVHNFESSVPSSSPFRRYFGRFDFDISPKNRITFSMTDRDQPIVSPSAVTVCPIECQSEDIVSYDPQLTDVWTFSPHFINEARIGYTWEGNFYNDDALGRGVPQELGWQFAKANTLPNVQFYRNYPYTWIAPATNAIYKEHVFAPSDVVTLIKGKHVLHFGGEFDIYEDNSTAWGNQNAGVLGFQGGYTTQWAPGSNGVAGQVQGTGLEYADFLLGYANNWNAAIQPEYGARLKAPQLFVQDDFKIKPNFTLNVGVRYQIRIGYSETHGNEATYDPTVLNPANNTPGAFWYGTTHANGRTSLEESKYNTVLPRAGFSWLMHPNMTLRGGFGMYAYLLSNDTYGGGLGALFESSGNASDQTNGVTPFLKFDGDGTNLQTGAPLPYTFSANSDPARYNGQNVGYTQYNTPSPQIYQYNLDVQEALNTNTSFELAYVGSHGYHLNFPTDINQVPVAKMQQFDTNADRPNPNFEQINGSTNDAISNYNSMQVQFNRRLAKGVSFDFNYTWSHFLDDQDSSGRGSQAGVITRQYEQAPLNYSNSNFDVRNNFKGMVVYQLPFGRGRQFMNHNFLLDEVLGGYQVSSTIQLRSGQPFSLTTFGSQNYSEPGSQTASFPNYTGLPIYGPGTHTSKEWYNPAAFTAVPTGATGAALFGDVRRNSLYGPGLELVNISAGKKFDIYENVKLQLRLDATNAFNHTSLGQPNGAYNNTYPTVPSSTGQITGTTVGNRTLQAAFRLEF